MLTLDEIQPVELQRNDLCIPATPIHRRGHLDVVVIWSWLREDMNGGIGGLLGEYLSTRLEVSYELLLDGALTGQFKELSSRIECWRASPPRLPSINISVSLSPTATLDCSPKWCLNELAGRVQSVLPDAVEKQLACDVFRAYSLSSPRTPLLALDIDRTAEANWNNANEGILLDVLNSRLVIEVQMPFLDKRQWARRRSRLSEVNVHVSPDGAIVVTLDESGINRHFVETILPVSLYSATSDNGSPVHLRVVDRRQVDAWLAAILLEPFFHHIGKSAASQWLESFRGAKGHQWDLEICLRMPAQVTSAWTRLRERGMGQFFVSFTRVSRILQRCIRTWASFLWFSNHEHFSDIYSSLSMFFFRASPPFIGKASRGDFTYDVLEPAKVAKALSRAIRFIPSIARSLHAWLRATQHPERTRYSPTSLKAALKVSKPPNWLHSALLSSETHIVDELVALAADANLCRQELEEDPCAELSLASRGKMLARTFRRRLRHLDGKTSAFQSMGPFALFLATIYANPRLSPRHRAELILRIHDKTTSKTHVMII